jgi:hypothetical protein
MCGDQQVQQSRIAPFPASLYRAPIHETSCAAGDFPFSGVPTQFIWTDTADSILEKI